MAKNERMRHWRYSSHDLAATAALGEALGQLVRPGDIIGLDGPLGAGKTTLTRSIARGMGLDPRAVSSPTFVVVNEYEPAGPGPALAHLDAYRVSGPDELESVDWERLTAPGARVVMVIEWASRIAEALPGPDRTAHIAIEHTDLTGRDFAILAPRQWADRPQAGALIALCGEGADVTPCPITGEPTPTDSPTWPFATEQARMADLHRWFAGEYRLSREVSDEDLPEG
jgi:tRNA threonylcarbamoyladenosine biosynthesis protein TsaE